MSTQVKAMRLCVSIINRGAIEAMVTIQTKATTKVLPSTPSPRMKSKTVTHFWLIEAPACCKKANPHCE